MPEMLLQLVSTVAWKTKYYDEPILRGTVDPSSAAATLARLQDPVKQSFDKINDDLKEVHSAHGKYVKELDKVSLCTS